MFSSLDRFQVMMNEEGEKRSQVESSSQDELNSLHASASLLILGREFEGKALRERKSLKVVKEIPSSRMDASFPLVSREVSSSSLLRLWDEMWRWWWACYFRTDWSRSTSTSSSPPSTYDQSQSYMTMQLKEREGVFLPPLVSYKFCSSSRLWLFLVS